jgi:adenylate cyclase
MATSLPTKVRHRLEGLLPFIVTGLLFGLLYNTLFYPRTPVEYLEAASIGVILGTAAGLAELTVLKQWLQRRSFAQAVLARTLGYSLLVAISLSLVLSIEPATLGECQYLECVGEYIAGPLFLRDLVFSTLFVGFAAISGQAILLIGTRNFTRLISGRYQKPREIRATFMFVDIRGSTGLAEKLGHELYSGFLRDFFEDVSGAVHAAKGEVYQYVGDEVVVVWPTPTGSGRWLACFNAMREVVAAEGREYRDKYGVVPEFKAGVHAGEVIVTEVGTLRKEYVYHGDVLNTAARIQAKCNEAGYDLLVSNAVLASLEPDLRTQFVPIGEMELRGRSEPVEVLGLLSSRVEAG